MPNTPDWSVEQNVFDFLEKKNRRPLSPGEKELIKGQRRINRRFFDAINALFNALPSVPDSGNAAGRKVSRRLEAVKKEFQKVPGERVPGCR